MSIDNGSVGQDDFLGGDNNDHFQGNDGNNLNGGDGNDHLYGSVGDDTLISGIGDDTLHAGYGHDDLTGGEGSDHFSFYAVGNFTVQDFDSSADLLIFETQATGIHNLDELVSLISDSEDTSEGVRSLY